MWLFTTIGFFSVVRKPRETKLTVRSRVAADLDRLRERYLPTLSPTVVNAGTDYPFRARVARKEFSKALARMGEDIGYTNFKNEVAKVSGKGRAEIYSGVWTRLLALEKCEPAFDPSLLPHPPAYTASSKAHLNAANTEAMKKLYEAARTGVMANLLSLQFKRVDKETGSKVGLMKSFSEHPAAPVNAYYNELITSVQKQLPEEDSHEREALPVLEMVHELHKAGYQRLRICPGMNSSGTAWRCSVTPVTNILRTHGAMTADFDADVAHYSSAQGSEYFGWRDAMDASARELAKNFVERFPEIAAKGKGEDWAYAGWYLQMLGFAEQGNFPLAYNDWGGAEVNPRFLPTSKFGIQSGLPMPPGGEALPPDE